MIAVENDCELMDRLYDFLAPTLEQEDLFLIRSPVCLTLDVRTVGVGGACMYVSVGCRVSSGRGCMFIGCRVVSVRFGPCWLGSARLVVP